MNHDFSIFIDGDVRTFVGDVDFERVQIERDLDGVGTEYTCKNCNEQLERLTDSSGANPFWAHRDGSPWCETSEHHDDEPADIRAHLVSDHDYTAGEAGELLEPESAHEHEHADDLAKPERIPFSWANSAAIILDDSDDSITVTISVGDPRGAFAFTIRRISDDAKNDIAGRLIMHVPYPGGGALHEKLTEHHEGTYLIG